MPMRSVSQNRTRSSCALVLLCGSLGARGVLTASRIAHGAVSWEDMAERRRLPVLSNARPPAAPAEEDDEARPPWHWVGFGTVAIFGGWLPLAYVAGAVSARVMAARFGTDASKEAIDLALAAMTSG